jgi:hypothetical protein
MSGWKTGTVASTSLKVPTDFSNEKQRKQARGKFLAMMMQQRVFLHPNYPGPVAQPDRAAAF